MDKDKKNERLNVELLTASIFSKVLYKIKFSDRKTSQFLLSTDLLKNYIKKDLLTVTTLHLERLYTRLLSDSNSKTLTFIQANGKIIFLTLIQDVCEDFLMKQYGYKIHVNSNELKQSLYTKNLLQDTEILFQVPFYAITDLESSLFRLIYYPIYSQASSSFIEALIDNLILEISNCVTYFIVLKSSKEILS